MFEWVKDVEFLKVKLCSGFTAIELFLMLRTSRYEVNRVRFASTDCSALSLCLYIRLSFGVSNNAMARSPLCRSVEGFSYPNLTIATTCRQVQTPAQKATFISISLSTAPTHPSLLRCNASTNVARTQTLSILHSSSSPSSLASPLSSCGGGEGNLGAS